jgi:hypothetical protein
MSTKKMEVLSADWHDKANGNHYATVLVRLFDPTTGDLVSQIAEVPGYGDVANVLGYMRATVEVEAGLEPGILRYGSDWSRLADIRPNHAAKYSTNSLRRWLVDSLDESAPIVFMFAGRIVDRPAGLAAKQVTA